MSGLISFGGRVKDEFAVQFKTQRISPLFKPFQFVRRERLRIRQSALAIKARVLRARQQKRRWTAMPRVRSSLRYQMK